MDPEICTGITYNFATFYGGIPSLMYAVLKQTSENPIFRFNLGSSNDITEFNLLVEALVNGTPDQLLQKYFSYSSSLTYDDIGPIMK
eukprot:gene61412-83998_t